MAAASSRRGVAEVLTVSLRWDWFHSLINFKGNTGVTLQRAASPPLL